MVVIIIIDIEIIFVVVFCVVSIRIIFLYGEVLEKIVILRKKILCEVFKIV